MYCFAAWFSVFDVFAMHSENKILYKIEKSCFKGKVTNERRRKILVS